MIENEAYKKFYGEFPLNMLLLYFHKKELSRTNSQLKKDMKT
jgi:hypothetical protein